MAERGLDISYNTVRRWFLKVGALIARNLRHMLPPPSDYWHLDEMVILIRRRHHWLWRAVDNEGEVLDFLVQSKRDAKAALNSMRKQQRFKSPGSAQRFLNIHSSVYNTFYVQRHLLSRSTFKRFRTDAFNVWENASAAI